MCYCLLFQMNFMNYAKSKPRKREKKVRPHNFYIRYVIKTLSLTFFGLLTVTLFNLVWKKNQSVHFKGPHEEPSRIDQIWNQECWRITTTVFHSKISINHVKDPTTPLIFI